MSVSQAFRSYPIQIKNLANCEVFGYHLGSSNYITNIAGEVSQHTEYFAFGETFVEEHKDSNNSPYKFNGKELDEESGLYYYGARYYDPRISIWTSVDPLAEKYPNFSPYVYCLNNPINFIDPDGRFVISPEFAKKYPNITNYIKNNLKSDVLGSNRIMDALVNNTKKWGHEENSGNLTREVLNTILTNGKGPNLVSKKAPGGNSAANGFTNLQTNSIELNEDRLKNLENTLSSSDCTGDDKMEALLGVFMTTIHEVGHYGDYLDQLGDGGEVGFNIEYEVWWNNDEGNQYTNNTDKYDTNTQKEIIKEKKGKGVLPTVPSNLKIKKEDAKKEDTKKQINNK